MVQSMKEFVPTAMSFMQSTSNDTWVSVLWLSINNVSKEGKLSSPVMTEILFPARCLINWLASLTRLTNSNINPLLQCRQFR